MQVFWDWNGTLCDDVLLSLEAVNAMLCRRKRSPITLQQYYSYMDTPIRRFYAHMFDLQQVSMAQLSDEFHAYYQQHLREDCLAAGAYPTLCLLKKAGVRQYVLSSSHRDSILPTLKRLRLLPFFEDVLAAEDWDAAPKAERAKAYCDLHGLRGDETWFIGDLLHDRDAALACGAHCLLLPIGHQSEQDLKTAGACFCLDFSEIPVRLGLQVSPVDFAKKIDI